MTEPHRLAPQAPVHAAQPSAHASLDLALIGNCAVSGLIDAQGRLVWACVPRFDGDPIFCNLLRDGDGQGVWEFAVEDAVSVVQAYARNAPVLRTVITDARGGAFEITDFCPRFPHYGRMFRPMAFMRRLRPIAGAPRITVRLRPMQDDGAAPAGVTRGANHIRYVGRAATLRLTTDAPVGYILGETPFRLDRPLTFYLGPDETFTEDVASAFERMEAETLRYWRQWVRLLALPLEWQDAVIRAAIALKLCWFEETGAIVAAMTTSIPEAPRSGRNWDYRFCWLRDAYYVVQALNRLGAADILEGYFAYLRNLAGMVPDGVIQPVYGIGLEARLDERIAAALPGYRGQGPVRIGNAAYTQIQNDVYGQIVLSTAQAFFDQRLFRPADDADFAVLERIGERAFAAHDQPDAGLWEFRTRARVHTYSALMGWAACDRLAKIARHMDKDERAALWAERAGAIRARIAHDAWNAEAGAFTAAFGSPELDASVMQMLDLGFLAPDDPRFLSTLDAIERTLKRGDHLLRYAAEDDFGKPESAFNICTFWYIEALARAGRKPEARALFETMLARRTRAGLLSEDIAVETGELWGNYPQTYSLVGLINCAVLLSEPWSTMR